MQELDTSVETYTSNLQDQIVAAHYSASSALSVADLLYQKAQNVTIQAMNISLPELQGTVIYIKEYQYEKP